MAVIVAIFLLLIGKSYLSVTSKAHELSKARRAHREPIADFQGLSSSQIESNLNQLKTQNSNLQAMSNYNNTITPILVEVVDSIPPEIWLTSIGYNDPFPAKGGEARSLQLEGVIKTGRDGRADMALGNKFREALIEQPIIRKMCGEKGVINYTNVAGTGGRSGQETTFTFNCGR